MRKLLVRGLKLFIVGVLIGGGIAFMSISTQGCAPHNRRAHLNVTTIDSSTNASVPSNIVVNIHLPSLEQTNVLLADVLTELRTYEASEGQSVNVTVDIHNDVVVENTVNVEGDTIVVKKHKDKKFPHLYHWFCKRNKKKCKGPCGLSKPCGND